jgi:hypothetical protein
VGELPWFTVWSSSSRLGRAAASVLAGWRSEPHAQEWFNPLSRRPAVAGAGPRWQHPPCREPAENRGGRGGRQAGGRAGVRPRLEPPGAAGHRRRARLGDDRRPGRRRPAWRPRAGAGPPGRGRHRRCPPGRPPRPPVLRPGPARPGGRGPAGRGLPGRVHAHPRPGVRAGLSRPHPQHPPQPAAGVPGRPRRPRGHRLRGQGQRLHRPPGRRGGRPRPGAVPVSGPGRARRRRGPPPRADQAGGAPAPPPGRPPARRGPGPGRGPPRPARHGRGGVPEGSGEPRGVPQ